MANRKSFPDQLDPKSMFLVIKWAMKCMSSSGCVEPRTSFFPFNTNQFQVTHSMPEDPQRRRGQASG